MAGKGMRQLSSRETRFFKDRFPLFAYGFLIAWSITGSVFTIRLGEFDAMFIIVPIGIVLILQFTMKLLVNDLVDAVYDDGDFLIVRNVDVEDRIALSNVTGINHAYYMQNPPRISLFLREESKFGKKVSFMLPYKLFLGTHPLVKELKERVKSFEAKAS